MFVALNVRRLLMRHLMLPRLRPTKYFTEPDPVTGRLSHLDYLVDPYYNPANFWTRWGPLALATRLLGGNVPGPARLHPQGFLITDIGPPGDMGKGAEGMARFEEKLKVTRLGACPYLG